MAVDRASVRMRCRDTQLLSLSLSLSISLSLSLSHCIPGSAQAHQYLCCAQCPVGYSVFTRDVGRQSADWS